ncbi:HD domain-containing protein [Sorangium sp. So ce887]|uniref:HD domain-containing protein n=1 Tax=Sorangium sp. So ce887 TaxID=3133324 RepID=UPI003F5FCD66
MPKIQRVLDQGGTPLLDFTLHDAGHAFRVAERMAEVVPPDVLSQLSGYELGLLLLSAYLHDIGMTPERSKFVAHRAYLITGERGDLTEYEVKIFQRTLDEDERGIEPPLTRGRPTNDELQLADEIVMYYCRERHNDWSGEWIENHLRELEPPLYPDWAKDLVTLCCSHHEGYQDLRSERFDPMLRGVRAVPVQLRYLACVLRVADILEFDPERTPDVILQHRDIAPDSRIYWAKDQAISFRIARNKNESIAHIAIAARPKDAYLHRAIEQTVEGVNIELETCRRLAEEQPFKVCPHHPRDLPHHWDLPVSITPDIRPQHGSYEYIDGAFRPNVSKVLSLLSGVELYKDPIVAVRELMQNAFDAVREKIARERLDLPDPMDQFDILALRKRHEVALRVESHSDKHWLVCKDNGVGMTKAIIRDHLLVSGIARRHDLVDLERRCRAAGFSIERTGQFGIGVLSYFMLADRITIDTCRDGNILSPPEGGWRFETEGIGRFGQLTPIQRTSRPGTEVRLRLKKNIIGEDLAKWTSRFEQYVTRTLAAVPCRFSFTRHDGSSWNLLPGWSATDDSLAHIILEDINRRKEDLNQIHGIPKNWWSEGTSADAESSRQWIERLEKDARSNLMWLRKEIDLPSGLGRARLTMPYFKLPGGNSLAFMRAKTDGRGFCVEKLLDDKHVFLPPGMVVLAAWNGMRTELNLPTRWDAPHVIAELDLIDRTAIKIDVGRFELEVAGPALRQIYAHIMQVGRDIIKEFIDNNRSTVYATLNHAAANVPLLVPIEPHWMFFGDNVARWQEFSFPVAEAVEFFWHNHRQQGKSGRLQGIGRWNGRDVLFLELIGSVGDSNQLSWHAPAHAPHRIVLHENSSGVGLSGLWLDGRVDTQRSDLEESLLNISMLTSDFPPSWSQVLLVSFDNTKTRRQAVVNRANPIIRALDPSALRWLRDAGQFPVIPREDITSNRARAAAWLLDVLRHTSRDGEEVWKALTERHSQLVHDVWQLVVGAPDVSIYLWEQYRNQLVRIVRPGHWETRSDTESLIRSHESMLHDPGLEWWIELPDATPRRRRRLRAPTGSKPRKS